LADARLGSDFPTPRRESEARSQHQRKARNGVRNYLRQIARVLKPAGKSWPPSKQGRTRPIKKTAHVVLRMGPTSLMSFSSSVSKIRIIWNRRNARILRPEVPGLQRTRIMESIVSCAAGVGYFQPPVELTAGANYSVRAGHQPENGRELGVGNFTSNIDSVARTR
jgi:hypothetical protein